MSGDEGSASTGGLRRLVPAAIRDRYVAKFVAIVLVVVLVITIVGGAGYVRATDTVDADTEEQLQSTAQLQSNSIGQWVADTERTTTVVARSEAVVEGDVEAIQRHFDRNWQSYDVRGIHYVDTSEGTVAASTDDGTRGESLDGVEEPWADAEYLESVEGYDDVRVSDRAYRSSLLGEDVVAFASPAFGWEDRHVVVVAGIEEQVETLHQRRADQETTVVDGEGRDVLTVPDDGSEGARLAVDATSVDDTTFGSFDGQVYAAAPVEGVEWAAVTTVPRDSAYAVSTTVRRTLGAIVLLSLVALLGAAVVLARHTVTPLQRLREQVARMEQGELDVDLSIARTDEIGQLYAGFATMRDSLQQTLTQVREAREEAETARAEAEETNRHLETKADEYGSVIEDWADGDLTRRLDPESRNEAMTAIATDLNRMVSDLERALADVKSFAGETAVASEEVTASTEEVRSASQQVTESIQEISAGADRQHDALSAAAEEMEDLSATTEEIASLSSEVADLAGQTAETGETGREDAREALDAMEQIEARSTSAVEEIRQLESEEVAQIDELIEYISQIAKETNMLALNANIEASRSAAGDEEGGFGVVAAEIKELSQDAKEAAEEIEQRLESIRDQTARSADEVEATSDLIEDAGERVERTVDSLDRIATFARQTNDGVQEITEATEAQAESTQEVVRTVDEVTSISEETSAQAETVASSAEEQNAALIETSESVEGLSRRASRLSEVLDRFETDVDGGIEELETREGRPET